MTPTPAPGQFASYVMGARFAACFGFVTTMFADRRNHMVSAAPFLSDMEMVGKRFGGYTEGQAAAIERLWENRNNIPPRASPRQRGMAGKRASQARARERDVPSIEELLK